MKLPNTLKTSFTLFCVTALAPIGAHALVFDQNVTPDVIFGSGNANGSYTVDRSNNVELGLRGKLRYNAAGNPENTFNSNGDGTYSFDAGVAPGQPANVGVWSFEWSINSDLDGTLGRALAELSYTIGIDLDSGLGTVFNTFDVINTVYFDHALGNSSTGNGDGFVANPLNYSGYINEYTVAQNSWQPQWFNGSFDPTVDGTYDFFLSASDQSGELARTDIQIIVGKGGARVPDSGSALSLLAGGLLCLVGGRRLMKR